MGQIEWGKELRAPRTICFESHTGTNVTKPFLGSKSVPQGAAILLKIDECNCIHTAGQQRDRMHSIRPKQSVPPQIMGSRDRGV